MWTKEEEEDGGGVRQAHAISSGADCKLQPICSIFTGLQTASINDPKHRGSKLQRCVLLKNGIYTRTHPGWMNGRMEGGGEFLYGHSGHASRHAAASWRLCDIDGGRRRPRASHVPAQFPLTGRRGRGFESRGDVMRIAVGQRERQKR